MKRFIPILVLLLLVLCAPVAFMQNGAKTVIIDPDKTPQQIGNGDVNIASLGVVQYENMTFNRKDPVYAEHTGNAKGQGYFSLYKENVNAPDYDYWVVWMEGTAMRWDSWHALQEFRLGSNSQQSSVVVTDHEPTSTIYKSSIPITIQMGIQHNGISVNISQTFQLPTQKVEPYDFNTDHYTFHYVGYTWDAIDMCGGVEYRVPKGLNWTYGISVYVRGSVI